MGRHLTFQAVLRGADVGVPHECLDIVDLVTSLFEAVSEGGTQGVGSGALGDAGGPDGCGDGSLNAAGV